MPRCKSVTSAWLALFVSAAMVGCESGTIGNQNTEAWASPALENPNDEPQSLDPVISVREISEILPAALSYGDQGVLWGDFDNSGTADLMYMGHGRIPGLYKQSDGKFVNVVSESGIKTGDWLYAQQADRHGASCADYDNDGNQDIFIGHGAKVGLTLGIKFDELLRGNGDFTFEDVTHSAGVQNQYGRTRAGQWVDINNDGWLDLYVGNYESANVMYISNGDGSFTDSTEQLNLGTTGFRSAWADFNNDGFLDVVQITPLQLHLSKSGEFFQDVTEQYLGDAEIFGYSPAWADLDKDGDQDLLVGRLGLGGLVFRNDGDTFTSLDFSAIGLTPQTAITGIAPADMNNDGALDIVMNTAEGLMIFESSGELEYELAYLSPRSESIVKMRNGDISIEDFDGDGLLDVATDDPDGYKLYRNTTYRPGNWLRVRFNGVSNNSMGYGNKVVISPANDSKHIFAEYLGANAGMRSNGCQPLQVGIGNSESVNIKVTWPDGKVSELDNVGANSLVLIDEP